MKQFSVIIIFILIGNSIFAQGKIFPIGYYLLNRDLIVKASVQGVGGFKLKLDIEGQVKGEIEKKTLKVWHNFSLKDRKSAKQEF